MLANRQLIKMVITILVLAVGYDVWHLTHRSSSKAKTSASASAGSSTASLSGSAASLPGTDLIKNIRHRLTAVERHRRREPLTPAARNPFLFRREQDQAMPLAKILEQEQRQREEEERRAREAAERSNTPPLDLTPYQLTAVLVRSGGSLAIINGHILGEGELLPGTSLRILSITPKGVALSLETPSSTSPPPTSQTATLGFAPQTTASTSAPSSRSPSNPPGSRP